MSVEVALPATSIGSKLAKQRAKTKDARNRQQKAQNRGEGLGEVGPTPSLTFQKKSKLNQEKNRKEKERQIPNKHSI